MSLTAFWTDFERNSNQWFHQLNSGQAQLVFQGIDALMADHGISYCFDVTSDDHGCYLVFSPEGDAAIAAEIDRLIALAPPILGWKMHGRRQRKPLDDVAAILKHLYLVDLDTAQFAVTEDDGRPYVTMFLHPQSDLTPDECSGLMNTFLWHAVGEGPVMERRISGEVVTAGPAKGAEMIAACELVQQLLRGEKPETA